MDALIEGLSRHPNWQVSRTLRGNIRLQINDRHGRPLFDPHYIKPPLSPANMRMLITSMRRQAAYRLLARRRDR
jgi:hypothetical protein